MREPKIGDKVRIKRITNDEGMLISHSEDVGTIEKIYHVAYRYPYEVIFEDGARIQYDLFEFDLFPDVFELWV